MAKSDTIDRAKDGAKENVRQAASNKWTERLMRFGYVARGLVYIIPGLLALALAIGMGGSFVNQTGALEYIGSMPYGKILLVIVGIGLAGYTLWGLVRATLDPFHEGEDAEGLAKRFGYIVSAFGYAVILVAVVQYLSGLAVTSNNPQDWTAKVMGQPWGRIAVGVVGLGWIIGGGIRQIWDGYTARFKKNLKTSRMSREERIWAIRTGRFGYIARGVVFGLIGLFLVQAAVFANPNKAQGLDGALLAVARSPEGPWLLAIVALGLIAFGVFSMLCARWMRMNLPRRAHAH